MAVYVHATPVLSTNRINYIHLFHNVLFVAVLCLLLVKITIYLRETICLLYTSNKQPVSVLVKAFDTLHQLKGTFDMFTIVRIS